MIGLAKFRINAAGAMLRAAISRNIHAEVDVMINTASGADHANFVAVTSNLQLPNAMVALSR